MKSNRTVALSFQDKIKGNFIQIEKLSLEDLTPVDIYLKGISFPMRLMKKSFKNEDDSVGILYLITNDLKKNGDEIYEIYQKRWKIEVYHKSIKSNTALKKSPTKTIRTQVNHVFASIYAYFKLEKLSLKTNMNHFQLKNKLLLKANQAAMKELAKIRTKYAIAA